MFYHTLRYKIHRARKNEDSVSLHNEDLIGQNVDNTKNRESSYPNTCSSNTTREKENMSR